MNNIYYESLILEQKLNYFILESRYNEMVLNESITDKLKNVKKWIIDRFKDLIKLFTSLKDRISKFFKEVVLKKIKQIKEKIFKNKSKKNDDILETIDIKMMLKDYENLNKVNAEIYLNIPKKFANFYTDNVDKINAIISEYIDYKFPTVDEAKKKAGIRIQLDEIDKTKIKITKKEIENLFKQYENELIDDVELYEDNLNENIDDCKSCYSNLIKINEGKYSDEKMNLLEKYCKVSIDFYTNFYTIQHRLNSLINQYALKALSYFDTYLKDNDEIPTNEFKEAVDNGKVLRVHIMLADSMILDPTFRYLNTELKYASKMTGLFDKHDGEKFEEDPYKWDNDYLNTIMVQLKRNFSRERLEHVKKVVKKLIPIKGDNNQKKR